MQFVKSNLWAFALLLVSPLVVAQEASPQIEKKYQRQIEKLAKHKKIQLAFEHILAREPQTLATLIELTEIPAPPL